MSSRDQREEINSVDSSSSDEEEDENGDLITDKINGGINEVLAALKSNDAHLLDKNYRFFPEVGAEGTRESKGPSKSEKPVFLKDYQREQLLNQHKEDAPLVTYNEEQENLRNDLIRGFHDDDEDAESEDDLLTKREMPHEIPDVGELPNPEDDADGFLNAFVNKKAWIANEKAVPTYNEVVDEEDSDEFDDLSEKFESAYNFRFEDPDAANIVSYTRDQASLRRKDMSSRQRKREREKEEKRKEEEKKKLEKSKIKKSKVNEITSKMAQLEEALGEGDEKLAELLSREDLDGDFDSAEWDKRMLKLFNDEYYNEGVDIREGERKSRKELKRKAEQFVDSNEDLVEDELLPAQSSFRYREVEPENFGLTARDILLASDQDLNQFAGIKKLASYRDKSRQEADRKRYGKSKRLRKWRQEVFGSEEPPSDEAWERAKAEFKDEFETNTKTEKKRKSNSDKKSDSKKRRRKH